MARRLTPAERLAAADRDLTLADITAASTWDRFLVEQAAYAFGLAHAEFSANQLRDVLPEQGHGYLGAALNSLRSAGIIAHTGRHVPSTSTATKGHRLAIWELTPRGREIAAQRRPAHREAA
ncbi:hypothetical protein [Streptomyces sp. SCSIO ZS0520]|uniref:hypothetical protein n=1 Tax=Streptomyces sp. SCSIO ZS0520 TaxID=2892996 RepID=UPI0021D92AD5|nr:hypothetical protein [Streptomyces sp. SCSIO ZS0520]